MSAKRPNGSSPFCFYKSNIRQNWLFLREPALIPLSREISWTSLRARLNPAGSEGTTLGVMVPCSEWGYRARSEYHARSEFSEYNSPMLLEMSEFLRKWHHPLGKLSLLWSWKLEGSHDFVIIYWFLDWWLFVRFKSIHWKDPISIFVMRQLCEGFLYYLV